VDGGRAVLRGEPADAEMKEEQTMTTLHVATDGDDSKDYIAFCNGEVGPVNGTTYLHGYTSAFGLFRPK
jgi:hypothetical protein